MAFANGPAAEPPPGQGVHDRDLDVPLARRPVEKRYRAPHLGQQRLIANPFLALLAVIVWFIVIRIEVQAKRLDLFLPTFVSIVLVYFLFQYHCLDCGATGRLTRWKDHACERVKLRTASGATPRYRTLTPIAQTVLWFYVLIAASIVGYILLH